MRVLRKICKEQHGFTVTEMVIAIALLGIIGAAIATGTSQVYTGSKLSTDRMTAVNNVRNAGEWISQDARMAENSITITDNCPSMSWTYYTPLTGEEPDQFSVVYTLSDGKLNRQYQKWTSGDPPVMEEDHNAIIAEHITINNASFSANSFSITLTATVGSVSETRTFVISLRDLPQ